MNMNLIVTPRGADLIETLSSRLEGIEKDYSETLVVFPGKRPAHFLRRELARKSGSSVIPPRILSIDEFIDFLCEKGRPVRKLEILDAVALLYEIHRHSENQMGGDSFETLDEKLKHIEAFLEEGVPKLTGKRLRSLTWFYEIFYRRVESIGLMTRSDRYRYALDTFSQTALNPWRQIVFAGFFALTDSEKKLFHALLKLDNTLFIFQQGAGLSEKLKDLGMSNPPDQESVPETELFFYSAPDSHGEVLTLGNELDNRIKNGFAVPESTVILLPSSESLFPLLRQGLSHLPEDSFNISLGYPLFRTPVFGFLNSLFELIVSMEGGKIYIPDYLKFVLHPYTKNVFFHRNSEITRVFFHTVEDRLLKNRSQLFISLSDIENDTVVFSESLKKMTGIEFQLTEKQLRDHIRWIHRSTIEKFFSIENMSDFANKGIELLLFVFQQSPAKLHPLFLPFSDSLIDAFEAISKSMMRNFSFSERTSYFVFLRRYIASCHTPFPGTPLKGVQVLGALETRNLKFKSVFVLDANEEVFPETKKDESLIPFRAREILSLPTYIDRDKLTAYYFDVLLGGASDVHLFFVENQKKEKSRFVEKLLWEKQKKEKTTHQNKLVKAVQYRVDLENKEPGPIPKNKEVIQYLRSYAYSATALDRYLKCPLRFYYASVLGLRPKEEMSVELERNELGSFIHLLLADYFQGKIGRKLDEKDLNRGEMERLIKDRFSSQYGNDISGARYLLNRQVKKHLIDFLENYTLPLIKRKSVTILACEENLNVEFSSYRLTGRIDRIERRNEKTVIIDYKTGSQSDHLKIDLTRFDLNRREDWSYAIGSLQLPFYILLYSEKENRTIENLEAMYLLLGRSKIGSEIELPLFNEIPAAEVFRLLKTVILGLLHEITDSSLPFFPTTDNKKNCQGCDY
ncbi:MAG: PD-(D/E)XK nuclease family protein, partial [Nitrospirae bacterium]|nr:PD-(D/E)XK nuclease family protein [Nitrospirota bacterium]